MQIAASTRSLWDLPFGEACNQLQHLGFDKAEIWINENFDHLKVTELAANVDSAVAKFREASRLSPVAIFLDEEIEAETDEHFDAVVTFANQLRVAQITIRASPLGTPFNSEIDRLRSRNLKCMAEGIRLSILTKTGLLTEDPHTAIELCQSVKGLGITLDPSYFVCNLKGEVDFDVVYPRVTHVHMRDSSHTELQVPCGLGEIDYNKIIASLRQEDFNRTLSVDLLPHTMEGEERHLEMRKLRLLLESLL